MQRTLHDRQFRKGINTPGIHSLKEYKSPRLDPAHLQTSGLV
jgi:hypothetical protein